MARALSNDLRRRVVAAVMEGGMARRSASGLRRRRRSSGSMHGGGRRSRRIEVQAATVLAMIEETPDMTLAEIAAHLEDAHGLRASQSTVWRFFHRRGITFKKNRARQRAAAT